MFEDIGVKVRIVYNTQTVGKYFSLKDSINRMYQSCLINKFTCPGDLNKQYFSMTERHLFVRIKEHVTLTNSAVFKHIEYRACCTNCNIIYNCFEIIKTCSSYKRIMI